MLFFSKSKKQIKPAVSKKRTLLQMRRNRFSLLGAFHSLNIFTVNTIVTFSCTCFRIFAPM